MRKARSRKKRPILLADLERRYRESYVIARCRAVEEKGFRRRFVEQLTRANLGSKLKRDIEIHVPSLNKEIDVPFGYQNGRFNLIQPVSFQASDPAQLRRTASAHAVNGIALYENPDNVLGDLELVVVGDFRSNAKAVRDDVQRILRQGRTKLYTSRKLNDLIQEIRVPWQGFRKRKTVTSPPRLVCPRHADPDAPLGEASTRSVPDIHAEFSGSEPHQDPREFL